MNAHAIPDDNPKTVFGLKKPPTHFTPPVAEMHLGLAMQNGGEKYGMMNWREKTVSSSVYYDAARRHLAAWWDGERVAPDSGVHHLGHAMACCAILLDAEAQANLNDDRPIPGTFAAKMAELVDAAMDAVAGEAPAAGKATAPSVARLARFKVGDRVVRRWSKDLGDGALATVRRVSVALDFTSYDIEFDWNDKIGRTQECVVAEDDLAPAPRFRVGDIVVPRRSRPLWSSPHDELLGRRCRIDRYSFANSEDGTPCLILSGVDAGLPADLIFDQDNVDPAPKFKVGDRVVNCGDLGTVTRVGSGVYAVRWDEYPNYGHETRWSESELTPAPSKATNESTTWAPRTEHTGGAG